MPAAPLAVRLASVTLHRVRIPFRGAFAHAAATRAEAENVVVRCTADDGTSGWGESVARDYVTGETTEGTVARCAAVPRSAWAASLDGPDDVAALLRDAGLDDANVARCAVEMALLDLLARRRGLPLHRLLAGAWPDLARLRRDAPPPYSGVLGLGTPVKTAVTAAKLRGYGFASVKVKLAADQAEDERRLRIARFVLGAAADIRVDANMGWALDHAVRMADAMRRYGVAAVEQPFAKDERDATREFGRRARFPVIVDESLCSEADARAALGDHPVPGDVLFSVKLAKLGGFLPALRVLALAERHGVPVQISCQVGESAILSAAGRHLALLAPNLRWLEGSYDRHLLADNVIAGDISVRRGGLAPALTGPGLGIDVDPARVERLAAETLALYLA